MATQKAQQRDALNSRLQAALENLYHNATPRHPYEDSLRYEREYDSWFEGTAQFEIEYIASGGAYGNHPGRIATNNALCAGRSKEYAHRAALHALEQAAVERARPAGMFTAQALRLLGRERREWSYSGNALWERISEYGKLSQYGRGGRTLAPERLIRDRRHSGFRQIDEDDLSGYSYEAKVELCQIVESFNRYVKSWCRDVPDLWREYVNLELDEEAHLAELELRAAGLTA